jgi:hypothetical protein
VKFEHFGALNIISQWQGQLALVWLPEVFFFNEFSHCGEKKNLEFCGMFCQTLKSAKLKKEKRKPSSFF